MFVVDSLGKLARRGALKLGGVTTYCKGGLVGCLSYLGAKALVSGEVKASLRDFLALDCSRRSNAE